MNATKQTKVAVATCVDGGSPLYDVTYPGRVDMDSKVPYSYLRRLAKQGYRVEVGAKFDTPTHVIEPTA